MTKNLKETVNETPEPKLTRLEIIELYRKLTALKNVKGFKLNYAINRTIASLAPLVKKFSFENHVPETDEYKAYNEALLEGYRAISKGRTMFTSEGENIDFDINSEEAKQFRVELNTQYAAMLTERKAQTKEYNAWITKPCGSDCEHPEDEAYNIYHIAVDEIPEETDKAVWDAIMIMIVE